MEYDYEEDKKYVDTMVEKITKVIKELDGNHFNINKYKKQVKKILDIAFKEIDDDFFKVYDRCHKKNKLLSGLISRGQNNHKREYLDIIEEILTELGKISPKKYFPVSNNHGYNKNDRNKVKINPKLKKSPFVYKDYGCI